jgi:hypothetical protein
MSPGTSCTADPAGNRIPWGAEQRGGQTMEDLFGDDWREHPWNCHDCNAAPGGLHHPGCDTEECPQCKGQAAFCEHAVDPAQLRSR